jgi:hypothetical protein
MASVSDLAALILQHRRTLESVFTSEMIKLKVTYGSAAVDQALREVAGELQRDRLSISGQRRRRWRASADARRVEQLHQRKAHAEPSPAEDTWARVPLPPLPPGWR